MTDVSIPLPVLPARVSPGRAYFQGKAGRRRRSGKQDVKGKGKERAFESEAGEEFSGLSEDAIYAGIKDNPLLKKLRQGTGRIVALEGETATPEIQKVLWFDEPSSDHSNGSGLIEELAWCGSTLIWSKGSSVYRKYSFSERPDDKQTIKQALFAYFDLPAAPEQEQDIHQPGHLSAQTSQLPRPRDSQTNRSGSNDLYGPFHSSTPIPPWSEDNVTASAAQEAASKLTSVRKVRVVAILQDEALRLYYPDGQHHIVPLNVPVRKVWAMERGIMLEKQMTPRTPLPDWWPSSSLAKDAQMVEPVFYSLLEPFEEARPVSKVSTIFDAPPAKPLHPLQARAQTKVSSMSPAALYQEQDERIVYLSDRKDLSEAIMVTFNAKTAKLSVWAYAHLVSKPLDEIETFRQHMQGQVYESGAHQGEGTASKRPARTSGTSFSAPHGTLGKRRRSSDGQNGPTSSSERDLPVSMEASEVSHPSGSTAVSRRISALLDRRKSQHNPDSTIADLLGGPQLSTKQHLSHSGGSTQDIAHRRTSILKGAISTGMDRRTSTTRNELSVSLDRMAIGALAAPPSVQYSQLPASQQSTASVTVDPGQLASHDKQERFDALVGHGEMERETSLIATPHYDNDARSNLYISRLYSTVLAGVSSQNEVDAVIFGVDDRQSTLAVIVPEQQSLALFKITLEHGREGSKLVCTPVRQLDAISITSVSATQTGSRDLVMLDSKKSLSLMTQNGWIIPLHLQTPAIPYKLHNPTLDSVEVYTHRPDGTENLSRVSTLLQTGFAVVDDMIRMLCSLLQEEGTSLLTHFWHHYRAADKVSPEQAVQALRYALLGPTHKSMVAEDASSDWDWLSATNGSDLGSNDGSPVQTGLSTQVQSLCMCALQLMSEERKLFVATQHDVELISVLVRALAHRLSACDYVDVALRDGAAMGQESDIPEHQQSTLDIPLPFDVYANLTERLSAKQTHWNPFLHLQDLVGKLPSGIGQSSDPVSRNFIALRSVLAVYDLFQAGSQDLASSERLESLILTCANRGMTYDDVASLNVAVSLPVREAIRHCQSCAPAGWPKRAFALVDRADQMATLKGPAVGRRREPISMKKRSQYTHESICDMSKHIKPVSYVQHIPKRKVKAKATRFSMDHRLDDVQRMLNYTSSIVTKLPKNVQPSEAELPAVQQEYLLALAQRTLALPVGHGMFFFRATARPRSVGISIPKVELSAKVLPSASVNAPSADDLPPEEKTWPYFHSGVATALHIAWSKEDFDASEYAFHKPAELNARHGGFLLGLGLTGQIRSLGTYQAFRYMDPKHEYTSIGLLLGLGAAYMGTSDAKVASALSIHTAALHPPSAAPLNVALSLQAAGLFGIGLLHVGSADRKIADNVLRDLSRIHITGTEHPDGCLEAYAVAAGFSYGLVMLGRGNNYGGPSDANILSTFKYLLEGGRGTHLPGAKRNVEGVLNAAVTSPAATIALGLTFLRTNRQDVADLLEIPQSLDRLDHVRNDLILLRAACRHLIRWDALSYTKASIESLVPSFVAASLKRSKGTAAGVPDDQEIAYWHIVAGGCLAVGLKFAGSAKVEAHTILVDYLDILARKLASITVTASLRSKLGYRSLQICINIICLALASVMAGTGELNVLRRLRVMHGQVKKDVSYGTHMAIHMALGILFLGKGRFTLGTSKVATAALLCSFYPVFPQYPSSNRFHLQALRHMWVLAVEPRFLLARDVDSGMSLYLRLKFKLREASESDEKELVTSKYLTAPTLTPSLESTISIQTDSPRYWPVTLDLAEVEDHLQFFIKHQTIFVKRKAGHLSYAQDPRGNRSLYTQPESEGATTFFDNGQTTRTLITKHSHLVNLVASFQSFSSLARTDLRSFCLVEGDDLQVTQASAAFTISVIAESLVQDKPEAIAVYRALAQAFQSFEGVPVCKPQELVFVKNFYGDDIQGTFSNSRRQSLVRRNFIDQAYIRAEREIDRMMTGESFTSKLASFVSAEIYAGAEPPHNLGLHTLVMPLLCFPARSILQCLRSTIQRMVREEEKASIVLETMLPVIMARMLRHLPVERIQMQTSETKLANIVAAALLYEMRSA